ncbi:hypothetical protein IWQ57_002505, partial [Coemansia nantahalensis]
MRPRGPHKLNFLIAHYLASGPLREAAAPLRQLLEADAAALLPRRHDWLGNTHRRTCDELAREHPHIAHDELLRMMGAIVASDCAALPMAGGTLLGRTYKRSGSPLAGSLCTELRRRLRQPGRPLNRAHQVPLGATGGAYRRLVRCHGHKFATFCALFDRTGRRLLTGSDDYLIKVWCTQTGYLINTFKGHQEVVTDMALNAEGTLLASSSTDGTVRIWNLKTGEPRAVIVTHPGGRAKPVTDVTFSPAPHAEIRYLATLCDDGLCRLYKWNRDSLTVDAAAVEIDPRTQPRDRVSSFAFNHTGSRLALATSSGFVSIYSTIAGAGDGGPGPWGPPKLIARIAAHDGSINTLVFSRDGDMLLTGSTDGTAKAWTCAGAGQRWTSVVADIKELPPDLQDAPPPALDAQLQPAAAAPAPVSEGPTAPLPLPQLSRRGSLALDAARTADAQPRDGEVELVADSTTAVVAGAAARDAQ